MDLNHVRGFAVYGNRPAIPESYSRLYSQAGSMPGTSQSRSTAHIPPSANARRYPPKPKATPKPKSVPKSKAKRGRKSYAAAQKEKQKDNILVSGPKMFIYCSGNSFFTPYVIILSARASKMGLKMRKWGQPKHSKSTGPENVSTQRFIECVSLLFWTGFTIPHINYPASPTKLIKHLQAKTSSILN